LTYEVVAQFKTGVTKRLNWRHLAFGCDNGAYDVTAAVTNQNTAVLIGFGLLIRPAVRTATALLLGYDIAEVLRVFRILA